MKVLKHKQEDQKNIQKGKIDGVKASEHSVSVTFESRDIFSYVWSNVAQWDTRYTKIT